jgi:Opioid growth factor receptor (OGFr) conserved region
MVDTAAPVENCNLSRPKTWSNPMDLVKFYQGLEPDDFGRWLRDFWSWDHQQLEAVHNYIQRMFPLDEASFFSASAPILDRAAIAEFRREPTILQNLMKSLEVMLDFYGFTLDREKKVVSAGPHFRECNPEWLFPNDHNHLRITRILKCLMLCGLEEHARAFYAALLQAAKRDEVSIETWDYWAAAVR